MRFVLIWGWKSFQYGRFRLKEERKKLADEKLLDFMIKIFFYLLILNFFEN